MQGSFALYNETLMLFPIVDMFFIQLITRSAVEGTFDMSLRFPIKELDRSS